MTTPAPRSTPSTGFFPSVSHTLGPPSITIDRPALAEVGDVLVAIGISQDLTGPVMAGPKLWDHVGTRPYLQWRQMEEDEPDSYVANFQGSLVGNVCARMMMIAVRPPDPIDGTYGLTAGPQVQTAFFEEYDVATVAGIESPPNTLVLAVFLQADDAETDHDIAEWQDTTPESIWYWRTPEVFPIAVAEVIYDFSTPSPFDPPISSWCAYENSGVRAAVLFQVNGPGIVSEVIYKSLRKRQADR